MFTNQISLTVFLVAALLFPACSSNNDNCHVDCFFMAVDFHCENGEAWVKGTPEGVLPCFEECPYWEDRWQCKRGCRIDLENLNGLFCSKRGPDGYGCALLLCEESRPKSAGDLCHEDLDCAWYEDPWNLNEKLFCNTVVGICEEK